MYIKNIDLSQGDEFNINIEILTRLSQGMLTHEISSDLKEKGIRPNSLSIIDKRLQAMRQELKCRTIHELMYKVGRLKLV